MNATLPKNTTLDIGIDGECPICATNRDPVTGNPRFNTKVRAAIEEGEAIFRGDKSAKWYKSMEEALEDLGV
jgi:hypothetical protein